MKCKRKEIIRDKKFSSHKVTVHFPWTTPKVSIIFPINSQNIRYSKNFLHLIMYKNFNMIKITSFMSTSLRSSGFSLPRSFNIDSFLKSGLSIRKEDSKFSYWQKFSHNWKFQCYIQTSIFSFYNKSKESCSKNFIPMYFNLFKWNLSLPKLFWWIIILLDFINMKKNWITL